jgi:hypothetical protein
MATSVAVVFFGLFMLSIGFLLWAGQLELGSKRGILRLTGVLLMAAAFLISACLRLFYIHTSKQTVVTGWITNLVVHHGKHSSSRFYVVRVDGSYVRVDADYTGTSLQNGESVTAKVLDFDGTLLYLRVLEGSNQGWELTEGNGTVTCLFWLAISVFFAVGGIRSWRSQPDAPDPPGDQAAPDGAVDEYSLLHLSSGATPPSEN